MNAPGSLKILVVGAGGIGCELLKNLVMEDFGSITVIDLDTIDISNLNRQFLFQRHHVGRPKAVVARESVLQFRPSCDISAIHKSILSSAFSVNFFASFDIVFNALDNRAARRHVNRMCVAAKRPLIESGTAGYLGQVEPLLPAGFPVIQCNGDNSLNSPPLRTGCYECQPRGTAQRTYPACTIRNTPSEPIHCVVWAKYLYNQLFGEPDVDDEDVSPDVNDPELRKGDDHRPMNGNGASEVVASQDQSSSSGTLRSWFKSLWAGVETQCHEPLLPAPVTALAWRLFHQDIITLIGMRDLWVDRQDRQEPTPLDRTTLSKATDAEFDISDPAEQGKENTQPELRDQRRLPKSGWLRMFMDSAVALQSRLLQSGSTSLVWDKDDSDSMDFVAGAAILRAQLFHLPGAGDLTRFVIKSLAGNIIPAIATTNAIIAGLMVLQARQILARAVKNIRSVYVQRFPVGRLGYRRLIIPCAPAPPNPSCFVCSSEATKPPLGLVCSPSSLSLRVLRDHILIRYLGMLAPDVELEDRGVILISSEEGETDEETLSKTLGDFSVTDGVRLLCDDFRQDFQVRLVVSTAVLTDSLSAKTDDILGAHDTDEGWRIVGDLDAMMAVTHNGPNEKPTSLPTSSHVEDDDEVTILSDDEGPVETREARSSGDTFKRPRVLDSNNVTVAPVASKRPRMDPTENSTHSSVVEDDVICLD